MVQWKKLNTSIYFFGPPVSPNLNYFFTPSYSLMGFFVLFSSLHLKSAKIAHSLHSLKTLNYLRFLVSQQPKNPQLPIVYSESCLFFYSTFWIFPTLTLRFYIWNSHTLASLHKLRKYICSNEGPFTDTHYWLQKWSQDGGVQSFASVSTLPPLSAFLLLEFCRAWEQLCIGKRGKVLLCMQQRPTSLELLAVILEELSPWLLLGVGRREWEGRGSEHYSFYNVVFILSLES